MAEEDATFEIRDHYEDGAWYDGEYVHIRGDVAYYARVAAETAGPILELACGTGRLTFPMAKAGARVHGVDIAPSMIARARATQHGLGEERTTFEVGDLRSLRLERTFSAVVLGFNTLMHMTSDADLQAALETVHVHLDPGGRFHFDLFVPNAELLGRDPNGRYDPQEMVHPATRERYIVTESSAYDPRTQINRMFFYYQRVDREGHAVGREARAELRLRVIFPRELDRWLDLSGFRIAGEWDDFDRASPFSGKGGRRVVVAEKK